ncbi:hypothetical protein Ddye_005169 [Dipteronia dyeriana]|uniref:RNase H type-1 domain-containing protein n=1 Tax=Dipteronia dyeriana TaxID=168575 RepID=A0AAD9XFM8_9ROSI|nr:hypothetical protein Ddye_005169 [Dipteronia dyeriana]
MLIHYFCIYKIPSSTLLNLRRCYCNFLYSGNIETPKLVTVPWVIACLSKDEGGLGIRDPVSLNKADNLKFCWDSISGNSAWSIYFQCNFLRKGGVGSPMKSSIISLVWDCFSSISRHSRWLVGDGSLINLWKDKWLDRSILSLVNYHGFSFPPIMLRIKLFRSSLALVLIRLQSFMILFGVSTQKSLGVRLFGSVSSLQRILFFFGVFFLESCLQMITFATKVFVLLQLALYAFVMRRLFTIFFMAAALRHSCGVGLPLILKTSLPMSGTLVVLWNSITSKYFSHQHYNMCISSSIQVVYDIWKARNDHRFHNNTPSVDCIISNLKAKILLNCSICPGYVSYTNSSLMDKLGVKPHIHKAPCITSCVWCLPSYPWIKANTDGCSKGNPGDGACSGVFHNGNSSFICGFSHNLGACTSFVAEMWDALHVINIAFDRGLRWLWLEVGSMVVISCFSNPNYSPPWQLRNFWFHSKYLINQMHFVTTNTFREGKMAADILKNEGLKVSGYVWWDNPPSCIAKQLHLDYWGVPAFHFHKLLYYSLFNNTLLIIYKKQDMILCSP